MSNTPQTEDTGDEPHEEYDFSKAEVGKYAERYQRCTNIVKLDEDVAKDFGNSQAVNEALRRYRKLTENRRTG